MRLPRASLACAIAACVVAVCEGGRAPAPDPSPHYVAPTFQKAAVSPVLLGEYAVPTSLSLGTTVKGKTDVALSLIQRPTGGVRGLITAAGKLANRDLSITSTVDDKGNIEAIVIDNGIAEGLSVRLTGNNKGKDLTDFAADIAADYTFSNPLGPAGFTGRVGMKGSHLSLAGVVGHGAALAGVATDFDADAGTLTEPALVASYTGSSYVLVAQGKAGGGNARLTFEQRITSSVSAAVGLFCTGNGPLFKGNDVTLAVQNVLTGGHTIRCKVDSATKSASLHATVKELVPHTFLVASAKVDSSGSPSFGLSAKISPPLPL